jgi:hypothetical protein
LPEVYLPPGTPVNVSLGARRANPTRVEDILGTVSPAPDTTGSRWWSRDAPVATGEKPAVPVQRQPVSAGTSNAGLPIRVPMAQLPGDEAGPDPRPGLPPEKAVHEPDPEEVSTMLSRFYGGVRRGSTDEEGRAGER